jgi:pimeloyl-ACP methyl ester carboxylesterase
MEMRQRTGPKLVRALILLHLALGSAALPGSGSTALGQTTARPSPSDSIDAAYRKFDAIRTFVRNRNAANYAITTPEGYGVQRKWANAFEGADQFLGGTIGLALVAPGYSVSDINDWLDGQILSGDLLVPQMHTHGPKEFGTGFGIPIFFFQGAEDFTTSTALAREYFGLIKAPHKEFVLIPDGGHFAVFMRSGEFLNELVKRVRPLAMEH